MKKLATITIVMLCFLVSCKKNKTQTINVESDKSIEIKENNFSENFVIIVVGSITKKDNFQVFYRESEADSHTEQKSVWVKVPPSDYKQEIKFEFPKDVYPMNLRIDLGNNKEQESIKINELVLKYKKYDFKIKGSDLFKYFVFNDGLEMLSDSLTFKLIPILYNGVEKHDPYMVGNKDFENILLEEL